MSLEVLFGLSMAVVLGGFVQGATGVGFALVVAPVMSFIAPDLLPVCLLALMIPLNFFVLWRERAQVDRPGASWITAGRLAGTVGGLWVLAALSASQLAVFVGAATALAALASIFMPAFSPTTPAYLCAGVVTGITETATGIGGPPLALVYQHQLPPRARSTIALCFLLGELVSLALLAAMGSVHREHLVATAELIPALAAGGLLSHAVHRRVDARFLRGFVIVFALVSGGVLILR
ncbi:MAG TPA: sulfite exporter TauE/SafE family protein [Ramlibacter sp.]|uniref:sulfite exporter TauE/SafE family protein n=1 Tax=Ramlibacter sp. TaxID=1917967 RepID=UPI002BDD9A3F|nr:sulfite exporter TauE/SafE family protein [Ramlibacter sp.]HVZ44040.1 sulfite exporter TauE/SafE family protein [Ramlibacter sp.]